MKEIIIFLEFTAGVNLLAVGLIKQIKLYLPLRMNVVRE